MNCSMCGAIIPSGQNVCPMCGAPVQTEQQPMNSQPVNPGMGQPVNPGMGQPVNPGMGQPVNPGMGQPVNPGMGQPMNPGMGQSMNPGMGQSMNPGMGQPVNPGMGQPVNPGMGYYQPKSGNSAFSAYINYMKSDPMAIVRIAAAFVMLLSAFLPWYSLKVSFWGYVDKEVYTLFSAGGVHVVTGIILILATAFLVLWEIADFIPALTPIKRQVQAVPFVDLIVIVVALIFVIIATASVSGVSEDYGIAGVKFSRIVGCVFAYIAIIAAATPRVLDIAGVKVGNKF